MKKERVKGGNYILMFSIITIFLITLVSANNLFNRIGITGRATDQAQNLTIGVSGANPVAITYVNAPAKPAAENSIRQVDVEVHLYDSDGYYDITDLDPSNLTINFTKDAVTRTGSCSYVNPMPPNEANYSCQVGMWYFDSIGDWNITVGAVDKGNKTWQYNTSALFYYSETPALVIYPGVITWPDSAFGDTNVTAIDFVTINNTANYNGPIFLKSINLLGDLDDSFMIPANNFTINITNQPTGDTHCLGTGLLNYTTPGDAVEIIGSNANPGNLSIPGEGQSEIHYCIPNFPLVASQTYSTTKGGSWLISFADI